MLDRGLEYEVIISFVIHFAYPSLLPILLTGQRVKDTFGPDVTQVLLGDHYGDLWRARGHARSDDYQREHDPGGTYQQPT
jgi:hypothetical protein